MQKLNIDISMQIVTVAVHTLLFITYMFTSNFYTGISYLGDEAQQHTRALEFRGIKPTEG